MKLLFIKTGAAFIAFGILFGAFGAHLLKNNLEPDSLSSLEVGIRYLIYHGIGLMILGIQEFTTPKADRILYRTIVIGISFFSGSIFVLSTHTLTQIPKMPFIPMTPIGGLLLIFSWVFFFFNSTLKSKREVDC